MSEDKGIFKTRITGWKMILERDDAEEVIDILCCVCRLHKHVTGLEVSREYRDLEKRASHMVDVLDKGLA